MTKKYLSLSQLRQDIIDGNNTLPKIVKYYLNQIQTHKDLNAVIETFEQEALQRAEEVQQKIISGKAGKLAGMVLTIKDNICYAGHSVTAGSGILKDYVSPYSSTVVQRMLNEDAVIIGRTNCDEFAMGSSNENSVYGPVKNYIDPKKVSGGSSGGSAVSLQADMCLATLGTDTGGSVRQPASFCGSIGLRPTYGRISRWGIIAYASSFDQVGIFGNTIDDVATILETIAGADNKDSTCTLVETDTYSDSTPNKPKKIAYIKEIIGHKGFDEDVSNHMIHFIKELQKMGHTVEPISFPLLDYLVPTYYILTSAEASSNLSRYDGIHYGHRNMEAKKLIDLYKKSRNEGFGAEVKRRIMLGTFVLSAGYFDAFYSKAQKVRRLIQEDTFKVLNEYDFILTPTCPTPAFELGQTDKEVTDNFLEDIFTVQSPLVGTPSISIPTETSSNGLPIGMQFTSTPYSEKELLQSSKHILKTIYNT